MDFGLVTGCFTFKCLAIITSPLKNIFNVCMRRSILAIHLFTYIVFDRLQCHRQLSRHEAIAVDEDMKDSNFMALSLVWRKYSLSQNMLVPFQVVGNVTGKKRKTEGGSWAWWCCFFLSWSVKDSQTPWRFSRERKWVMETWVQGLPGKTAGNSRSWGEGQEKTGWTCRIRQFYGWQGSGGQVIIILYSQMSFPPKFCPNQAMSTPMQLMCC